MDESQALEWITTIVKQELDDDDVHLTMVTLPADIEGWDSLAHVGIVVSLERGVGRQFTTDQIASLESVGDLVRLVLNAAAD